ncbi:acetylglutamate kinase [Thalassomonas viridans]|uniref:Acetylglutamate kinase n=1 Tax=Thalassomonas viridans TaxID=137584 RepID=A0AAE9Z2D4_9GAMM|nr:acetylglutamate kinase [Thalassomonas viridans]WDE04759.1 acetylglutamate kinase [Thalassomonas viridans]
MAIASFRTPPALTDRGEDVKKLTGNTRKKPLVIKIGGAILNQASALNALLAVISRLKDQAVVLVHGGGCVVDDRLEQAGFTTEKKNGLRVTPKAQIPVISGALAGNVNKSIVAQAAGLNIPAVGLSLCDGDMVACRLAAPELGAVGKPLPRSSKLLDTLLLGRFLPVIASIGALDNGELVNVNADDAAVVICQLLNAELLLLTDVNGVKDAQNQYLKTLNSCQAGQLIEQGVIAGGMTAKVNAALKAANQLRRSIAVASWQSPEQIIHLLNGDGAGTRIQPDS